MCVCTDVPEHECTVRGQLVEVGVLLHLCGFWDQIQMATFGGRSLYPLSYLLGPAYKIHMQLKFTPNLHLFMENLS